MSEATPISDDRSGERIAMSRLRRRIGENMVRSLATSPHVTVSVDVDYTSIESRRDELGDEWSHRHGYRLGYLPFVARAVCIALGRYPDLNASVDGTDLIVYPFVNLGIAVDLDGRGLVVPVIKGAQALAPTALASAIHQTGRSAREKRLRPDDVAGGTFTITSMGRRGPDRSTPIIHQPQVAILSVDAIRDRAVADPVDRSRVTGHPCGALSLSFDHRVADGVYAAGFVNDLRDMLESDLEYSFDL